MENITYYIVIAIILLAMETLYLPIARKVGIGDPVTPRSSHKVYTLTGGGFIFFIGAIICTLWFHEVTSTTMPKLLICGGALFLLSFIDDYREISPGFRLTIHAAIVTYTFYPVILNGHLDIFLILLLIDPLYLSALCGLFGGGDMNGIALLCPEWAVRCLSGALLIANALVFWRRILPVYRQSFSERRTA